MAITVRKLTRPLALAMSAAVNATIRSIVDTVATTLPHYDITGSTSGTDAAPVITPLAVTAATAVDLPTTIALAENIRSVMLTMMADTVAHKIADATNIALITVATVPTAVDQGTVDTLLAALKAAHNAHCSQSGVHSHSDATNTNSTTAATTLVTSEALANALAANVTAHILFAWPSPSLNLILP